MTTMKLAKNAISVCAAIALTLTGCASIETTTPEPSVTALQKVATPNNEQIEAQRRQNPHPTDMNHPSRWAPGCSQNSAIAFAGSTTPGEVGRASLQRARTLVDMGPRQFATGTATYDDDGQPVAYTVAAGDAGEAIGARFCIDYITVMPFNDTFPMIHPGDVLRLRP